MEWSWYEVGVAGWRGEKEREESRWLLTAYWSLKSTELGKGVWEGLARSAVTKNSLQLMAAMQKLPGRLEVQLHATVPTDTTSSNRTGAARREKKRLSFLPPPVSQSLLHPPQFPTLGSLTFILTLCKLQSLYSPVYNSIQLTPGSINRRGRRNLYDLDAKCHSHSCRSLDTVDRVIIPASSSFSSSGKKEERRARLQPAATVVKTLKYIPKDKNKTQLTQAHCISTPRACRSRQFSFCSCTCC